MCGRYTLIARPEVLAAQFELSAPPDWRPRYNIAPSQQVPAVRLLRQGERQLDMLRWGLIPSWAKDPGIGQRLINARAETVASKPAFRRALASRRCLLIADGFYEWQRQGRGKQPYLLRRRNGAPFAFAGLWEHWRQGEQTVETCTILTTTPNALIAPIHDRMPVILRPEHYADWLDPQLQDPVQLTPLLGPYPAEELEAVPVSHWVNSPQNDDPRCIAPLVSEEEEEG